MMFRRKKPRVPDPGQKVALLAGGEWRGGFRAVSGPLTGKDGDIVVLVAEEEEYREARRADRRPVRMPWPVDALRIEE